MFGECYFEMTKDQADERLEVEKGKVEEEMNGLKAELKQSQTKR